LRASAWAAPVSASASSSAIFSSVPCANPSAAPAQFTNALIGAALAEGLGIFSLVIALLLLFT
jgi:F0F1-type ATP synthase membrane subunit c/vacuolar-type H+-ATPase subunit K